MRCPHCSRTLRYVDRPFRRCSKCKNAFALEPREDPLGLSDLRLRALAGRLSDQGKFYYTPAQLFHFASRKLVAAQYEQPSCMFGCLIPISIIIGTIVGVFLLTITDSFLGFLGGIGVGALIGYNLFRRLRRHGPRRVTLSKDLTKFQQIVSSRWQTAYGTDPTGWLNTQMQRRDFSRDPTTQAMRAVLVCPECDILLCLRANGIVDALGLDLLLFDEAALAAADQALLRLLQSRPQLPVFLIHDASIDGCLFVQNVRQRLGLSNQQHIINLGLHPRQAMRDNLMRLRSPANAKKLAQLKPLVKPTADQPSQGLSALGRLTPAEYEWLAQGYYTPLLSITPKRLLKTVTQGVLAATPPTTDQAHLSFMDWPQSQEVA